MFVVLQIRLRLLLGSNIVYACVWCAPCHADRLMTVLCSICTCKAIATLKKLSLFSLLGSDHVVMAI